MVDSFRFADDEGQRRLVSHVIDRVRSSLAGADGEDLVDLLPVRSIFAGVLQPPRARDEEAARDGIAVGGAPAGTALGLDFRVKPNDPNGSVLISARLSWAHYFAVFPTFQQLRLVTPGEPPDVVATTSQTSDSSTSIHANEDEQVEEHVEEIEGQESDQKAAESTESAAPAGQAVVPRTWRRLEASAEVNSISVKPRTSSLYGEVQIADAVDEAKSRAKADPRCWHHLGRADQRTRIIGPAALFNDESAYERGLGDKRGHPVDLPEWRPTLQIVVEPDTTLAGVWRVQVLLSNQTAERGDEKLDPGLEERSIYDAKVIVDVDKGDLVPFDFLLAPKDYRSNRTMHAKGINCSALWSSDTPSRLTTETLPVFFQPLYRTRDSLAVEFEALAIGSPEESLSRIHREMLDYVGAWREFLSSSDAERLTDAERAQCSRDCYAFEDEARDFDLGLEVLRQNDTLRAAFQKMNRAFSLLGARSGGRLKSWRLFQIAFICAQLPSLAARELQPDANDEYAKAARSHLNDVGILWFPTGGGKTEAYLGLIATAMLYDRLRGKDRGVTAWMRFPLRMLSLQQLDRLAKVIAVLNEVRASDTTIGTGDPFGIGYYVGDNNTPNAVSEEDMRRYEGSKQLRETIRLLRYCPHCGSPVDLVTRRASWRMCHVCTNSNCFSNVSNSLGNIRGSLPVYVVDNEVYRYLPSVIVGTVDKLAIIGRSAHFHQLVRGSTQRCPQHGYTSYGRCIESWTGCKRTKSQFDVLQPVRDPGPSLLIQDELHLLRDELGVFNGHYEGLIRFIGHRAHMPAKVLCATATIEAYDVQAFHIYLAAARRFPQLGWRAGESFYATSSPTIHRRHFVGVYSHTRAIEDAALRVTTLYQREIRRLKRDPELCRHLMNSHDLGDDQVEATLHLHDLSVSYVNKKAVGSNLIERLNRANQVLVRDGLGEMRGTLLTSDQNTDEIGAIMDLIERQLLNGDEPRLDVVAATSLISHGVDLERINMMAVCGMPSHYAEYVQASSRCARSHAGVVFVCFNGRDPRERSQHEFFQQMHGHMDRLIEAVAVNRFASYAPRKTVPGLLIGLLLNIYTPDLFGTRISRTLDHIPTLQGAIGIRPSPGGASIAADSIRKDLENIIGVDDVHPPASPAQTMNARQQVRLAFDDAWGAINRTIEPKLQDVLDPITSFRDVDEGTEFGSKDSASVVTRLRVR